MQITLNVSEKNLMVLMKAAADEDVSTEVIVNRLIDKFVEENTAEKIVAKERKFVMEGDDVPKKPYSEMTVQEMFASLKGYVVNPGKDEEIEDSENL